MQSPCEVIDRLLRNTGAERMGLTDGPWSDTLRKWTRQGYPKDEKGNPVSPVDHFQYDMCGCGGWFDWHPHVGFSEVLEETEEWKVVKNGSGAVLKWWKDKSGTPEHIDFGMTSREVWDREYRPLLLEHPEKRVNLQSAKENLDRRREEGYWTFFGHLFIWEGMRQSMGDYTMYTSLLTDPDWIHDYNRVYTDLYLRCYQLLFDEAGLPDGIWMYEDLGYKGALFCSPQTLEELIFPYYKEVVDFFHGYNLPVVLHTCGYTEPALDLIVQTGFEGLHPMEAKAGNDLFKIGGKYTEQLALVGGLDVRIFETNDKNIIRKEVIQHIQRMKDLGVRWVFGSDHSLSTNIDYDSYLYAVELYREHCAY